MTRLDEARQILRDLGMPPAQSNEIAALTLLVMAHVGRRGQWSKAQPQALTIHGILARMKTMHGRSYAENTRETIRRQVLHQFTQAAIVERNPDDPSLATNSPRTHYRLTGEVTELLASFGTRSWLGNVDRFRAAQPALRDVYAKKRERHQVHLRLANGSEVVLSPGSHNALQALIVKEFGPRFAPGATLLYLGDAANKAVVLHGRLASFGFDAAQHGKLPDVVLVDDTAGVLFLIEAVTSHGPVSPKRQIELEDLLRNCDLTRAYVSAFLDFAAFKKHAPNIGWETDVWIAEVPDHLIHFNGGELQWTPPAQE